MGPGVAFTPGPVHSMASPKKKSPRHKRRDLRAGAKAKPPKKPGLYQRRDMRAED